LRATCRLPKKEPALGRCAVVHAQTHILKREMCSLHMLQAGSRTAGTKRRRSLRQAGLAPWQDAVSAADAAAATAAAADDDVPAKRTRHHLATATAATAAAGLPHAASAATTLARPAAADSHAARQSGLSSGGGSRSSGGSLVDRTARVASKAPKARAINQQVPSC